MSCFEGEGRIDGYGSEHMRKFKSRCWNCFDLAPWMQWVAFDVAFSNPFGFVKTAYDVGGLVGSWRKLMTLADTLSIFSELFHSYSSLDFSR